MFAFRLACAAVLVSALAAGVPRAASAQGFSGGGLASGGFQPPVKGGGVVPNRSLPAPPALPGAAAHGTAAPASKPATDMPPTEALFDAINRGDLGTVQDALSRGADFDGRNVLGMTPLELSVDLGRNDITFLLLSMRGSLPEAHGAGPGTHAAGTADQAPRMTQATRPAPTRHLQATVRAVRPQPDVLAPASVRYAGASPGSPVPAAGFLGFGP